MLRNNKKTILIFISALLSSVLIIAADQELNAENSSIEKMKEAGDRVFVPHDADNSGRNVLDFDLNAQTAQDQSNLQSDLELAARIRRSMLNQKSLGFNAKNVKVIVQSNKVTLRGPVASLQEKKIIEDIAEQIALGSRIENQLEIKKG